MMHVRLMFGSDPKNVSFPVRSLYDATFPGGIERFARCAFKSSSHLTQGRKMVNFFSRRILVRSGSSGHPSWSLSSSSARTFGTAWYSFSVHAT